MVLLILIIFGICILTEAAELLAILIPVALLLWLLVIVLAWIFSAILGLLFLIALLSGVVIAGYGLYQMNRWIFNTAKRKGYVSIYFLSLPISLMIVSISLAGLTGSGFSNNAAVHTQQTVWFFWTKDVVSYKEIPTVWRILLEVGFWILQLGMAAFVVEWLLQERSRKTGPTTAKRKWKKRRSSKELHI